MIWLVTASSDFVLVTFCGDRTRFGDTSGVGLGQRHMIESDFLRCTL